MPSEKNLEEARQAIFSMGSRNPSTRPAKTIEQELISVLEDLLEANQAHTKAYGDRDALNRACAQQECAEARARGVLNRAKR